MSENHETEDHHSPSRKDLYVVLVLTPLLIIGAGYGLARFYFKPAEAGLQLQLEQLATKLGALTNVHSAGNHGDGHSAGKGGHGTAHSGGHWNYDDKSTEGPAHWGDLKPEFAIASQGIRQSPIDLVESDAISVPELKAIEFRYQPSSMVVTNNGHTIQGNMSGDNTMIVQGKTYKLLQFHFHAHSEHTFAGTKYPLEVHLVHILADDPAAPKAGTKTAALIEAAIAECVMCSNDSKADHHPAEKTKAEPKPAAPAAKKPVLAVIGVMIQQGKDSEPVKSFWNDLPKVSGDSKVSPPFNPAIFLPNARSYYRYNGSLTTPPCSEGVLWTVMKSPIEFSSDQVKSFVEIFPLNARPVQPIQRRFIMQFNDGGKPANN